MNCSKATALLKVVSGNFLDMFDFIVYGFYASAIARTFFPADSAFAPLWQKRPWSLILINLSPRSSLR